MSREQALQEKLRNAGDRRDWDECDRIEEELDTGTRSKFGARNQREARRTALSIVAKLIENYFDVGQPDTDAMIEGVPEADVERLRDALERIRDRMASLSKSKGGV
jgi:hypothetical protein